jgi:hypothetical protein
VPEAGASGERREPGPATVFVSHRRLPESAAAGTALTALAATAALSLLGLARAPCGHRVSKGAPATSLLPLQLGSGLILEGLVLLHQMETDAIEAVSGVAVAGSLNLAFAALKGVEKSKTDGRVVLGDAKAHLIEGVAESGVAELDLLKSRPPTTEICALEGDFEYCPRCNVGLPRRVLQNLTRGALELCPNCGQAVLYWKPKLKLQKW